MILEPFCILLAKIIKIRPCNLELVSVIVG